MHIVFATLYKQAQGIYIGSNEKKGYTSRETDMAPVVITSRSPPHDVRFTTLIVLKKGQKECKNIQQLGFANGHPLNY